MPDGPSRTDLETDSAPRSPVSVVEQRKPAEFGLRWVPTVGGNLRHGVPRGSGSGEPGRTLCGLEALASPAPRWATPPLCPSCVRRAAEQGIAVLV